MLLQASRTRNPKQSIVHFYIMTKLYKHQPTHYLASTSRMRKAISLWQWQAFAAMDSCLALIRDHQRGITVGPLKAVYQKPFTAEASAKE